MSGAAQGRFLTGSTMGHVVRMTATGAFGITFVFLMDAMNLFWLSQLGEPQLVAAIGFAYAIQFFSVSSGIGLMIAGTAIVSKTIGQGDRDFARSQAGGAVLVAAVVQLCVGALIFVFRHDLIAMSGATGETARLATRYLGMTVFSLVPMAIAMTCSGVMRADGYGAKAMYVTLFSGAILGVLDPILIFWMELGLDGAAYGLILFRIFLMIFGVYFAVIQLKLVDKPSKVALRKMLWPFALIAVPTIATQMATPFGNYLLTIVMAQFGDDAVGAWAVVSRLTVLVFGGIFSLSGAIGGIFGQNFGAGQMDRVKATYRDALIFCLIYTLVAWALLASAGDAVAYAFGLTGQGAEVLRAFTTLGVGGFIFIGALFVSNAAFNNLGAPVRSTLMNWINHGILSWPLAMVMAGALGAPGVIYGQSLAGVLAGTFAAIWTWRFVQRLEPEQALDPETARKYPPIGAHPDRYRTR